jgi:DNA/RNA-binding domain of Phe-tRNA-synthetase-like protein
LAFLSAAASRYADAEQKWQAEQRIVANTLARFADRPASEHYLASKYGAFYTGLGLNPKRVSTPAKQVERVLRSRTWRSVSPEIDICMEIEFSTLFSVQVYDLDAIKGDVLICRTAVDGDVITNMQGETTLCRPGDLILADEAGPIHSALQGNDIRGRITEASRRILVRLLGVPGVVTAEFDAAILRLSESLRAIAVGEVSGTAREVFLETDVAGCATKNTVDRDDNL